MLEYIFPESGSPFYWAAFAIAAANVIILTWKFVGRRLAYQTI